MAIDAEHSTHSLRFEKFTKVVFHRGFPVTQTLKNLPAVWETQFQSWSLKDFLKKGMATHFSILDWRIPWTEEPGGLYSPWSHEESDMHFIGRIMELLLYYYFKNKFIYFDWRLITLQYCSGFAIH